jgi:hypothetical protein
MTASRLPTGSPAISCPIDEPPLSRSATAHSGRMRSFRLRIAGGCSDRDEPEHHDDDDHREIAAIRCRG